MGARCLNVISWKHSFSRLNEENEIAKKKKLALTSLYEKGRISQSTYDSFNVEIAAAIAEIEKQQNDLIQKMQAKTSDLNSQIKSLEILLANYEIQHVAGEIDDNTYTLEINMLNNGLETAKHELETIQNAVNQLSNPVTAETTAQPTAVPTPDRSRAGKTLPNRSTGPGEPPCPPSPVRCKKFAVHVPLPLQGRG